jgi:hypothetical protein
MEWSGEQRVKKRARKACDVRAWLARARTGADAENIQQVCRRKKIRCLGVVPGQSTCAYWSVRLDATSFELTRVFSQRGSRQRMLLYRRRAQVAAVERVSVDAADTALDCVLNRLFDSYVEGLERRVKDLEERLRRASRSPPKLETSPAATKSPPAGQGHSPNPPVPPSECLTPDADESEASESDTEFHFVRQDFKDLQIAELGRSRKDDPLTSDDQRGFLGKTSGLRLIREVERLSSGSLTDGREFFGSRPAFRRVTPGLFDDADTSNMQLPWPEPDLARSLIDVYFALCNPLFPIVHRPTFIRQWNNPDMRRDRGWTSLAFGIFALASKYTEDPRVLGSPEEKHRHSAGVEYWKTARSVQGAVLRDPGDARHTLTPTFHTGH